MNASIPRRTMLRAVPVASVAGLNGCLGSDDGSTSDDGGPSCTMFDQEGQNDPPLRNVKVVPWDGNPAILRVTLVGSELDETGARWIDIYEPETDASGPEYAIPINVGETGPSDRSDDADVVYKEQAIGTMPVSGRFRVEVTDGDTALAWQEFSFECVGETERDR